MRTAYAKLFLYDPLLQTEKTAPIFCLFITIHHITRAGGIVIQNDGKQDVSQQLQGWIHVCFES